MTRPPSSGSTRLSTISIVGAHAVVTLETTQNASPIAVRCSQAKSNEVSDTLSAPARSCSPRRSSSTVLVWDCPFGPASQKSPCLVFKLFHPRGRLRHRNKMTSVPTCANHLATQRFSSSRAASSRLYWRSSPEIRTSWAWQLNEESWRLVAESIRSGNQPTSWAATARSCRLDVHCSSSIEVVVLWEFTALVCGSRVEVSSLSTSVRVLDWLVFSNVDLVAIGVGELVQTHIFAPSQPHRVPLRGTRLDNAIGLLRNWNVVLPFRVSKRRASPSRAPIRAVIVRQHERSSKPCRSSDARRRRLAAADCVPVAPRGEASRRQRMRRKGNG